jgi:hypothetical protein
MTSFVLFEFIIDRIFANEVSLTDVVPIVLLRSKPVDLASQAVLGRFGLDLGLAFLWNAEGMGGSLGLCFCAYSSVFLAVRVLLSLLSSNSLTTRPRSNR